MQAPARRIADNAGRDGSAVADEVLAKTGPHGDHALTGDYGDLSAAGVIDPTKVVRSALTNAAGIAGLMLTAQALVTKIAEPGEDKLPAVEGAVRWGPEGGIERSPAPIRPRALDSPPGSGWAVFVFAPSDRRRPPEPAARKAVFAASERNDIAERVAARTFRRSPAARPIGAGYDVRAVQELLGHADVRTTTACAHALNGGGRGAAGPAGCDLPDPGVTRENARALSRDVSEKH